MSLLDHAPANFDAKSIAYVRSVPFFAKLPDETLTRLLVRCSMQNVPNEHILFHQGDMGDALYVILSGEIQLLQPYEDSGVLLAVLRAGEYFGEMALLDNEPRSATARTSQESVLLRVYKQDFLDLFHEHPSLFGDAIRVLSARLREMNTKKLDSLLHEKRELELSNQRLRTSYQATLEALSVALDLRDQATLGHSHRVTSYTLLIADALGVPPELREALRLGALLHDIGKIGVSDSILRKTTSLTPAEWLEMKKHPEWGAAIIAKIEFLREARDIVLAHHEKFDGTGYPYGLSGANIPLGARIFAIADVFDAVTTFRPYRMPMSPDDAASLIRREAGRHFDPQIVIAFNQALPQMVQVMRASFTGELKRVAKKEPPV